MTAFQMNERKALDAFQEEMDRFGLKVARSTSGCFGDDTLETYRLRMQTEYLPVKGNKELLLELKRQRYCIDKYGDRDRRTGRISYRFTVRKTVTISTKEVA